MPTRFTDRVVVVTGAARGIGLQTALQFAREGAQVVVADLAPDAVAAAVARLRAEGGSASGLAGDVADVAQVRAHVDEVLATHGRIDVLVNNAATMANGPTTELSAESWRRVMAVNLDGPFYWSQAVAQRSMIPRRSGVIIHIASAAGQQGIPHAAAYVASKHGLIGLMRSMAVDWGQFNIRVNAMAPSLTWTEMAKAGRDRYPEMYAERERRIPLGRACSPEDQANAILFLASDEAPMMHGQVLLVDGGVGALSAGYSPPRDGG